jgi:hypothetical protein
MVGRRDRIREEETWGRAVDWRKHAIDEIREGVDLS